MAEQLLRDREVVERLGIGKNLMWEWTRTGYFVQPVRLGKRVTRWRASEVDAWIAEKAQNKKVA